VSWLDMLIGSQVTGLFDSATVRVPVSSARAVRTQDDDKTAAAPACSAERRVNPCVIALSRAPRRVEAVTLVRSSVPKCRTSLLPDRRFPGCYFRLPGHPGDGRIGGTGSLQTQLYDASGVPSLSAFSAPRVACSAQIPGVSCPNDRLRRQAPHSGYDLDTSRLFDWTAAGRMMASADRAPWANDGLPGPTRRV
jgi:hypothetical protein